MAETKNIQKSEEHSVSVTKAEEDATNETSGIETNSVSADETETSASGASVGENESRSKSKERAIRNAFIAGFLLVAILFMGCSVFTKQNEKEKNVAEVADMYEVYAQMPEKSRLLFLKSFFENKTETASYIIDSQRESMVKVMEMAEIDSEQAQRLAIMFSGRAHILTQIWDLAPQYVLALDQVLIDNIKKGTATEDNFTLEVDMTLFSILAEAVNSVNNPPLNK